VIEFDLAAILWWRFWG